MLSSSLFCLSSQGPSLTFEDLKMFYSSDKTSPDERDSSDFDMGLRVKGRKKQSEVSVLQGLVVLEVNVTSHRC